MTRIATLATGSKRASQTDKRAPKSKRFPLPKVAAATKAQLMSFDKEIFVRAAELAKDDPALRTGDMTLDFRLVLALRARIEADATTIATLEKMIDGNERCDS